MITQLAHVVADGPLLPLLLVSGVIGVVVFWLSRT